MNLNKKKNKKAAFEMSITTIVILVIALSMLIFGLIFVRNMMCSGMNIMTGVTSGTQKEIDNLFSTQGGEIACLGQAPDIQDIYPAGKMQNAYCSFNLEKSKTYSVSMGAIAVGPNNGFTQQQIASLVSLAQTEINANLNDIVPQSVLYINIPKDFPEGFFTVKVTFTNKASPQDKTDRLLQFNVKRLGTVKGAIC